MSVLQHHTRVDRRLNRGFTLIELMIVVAIIAILAAIAYPSYQSHVIKTRRSAAAACSLEVAQFMERYYTTNLRYLVAVGGAAPAIPAMQCRTDLAAHYTIGLANGTTETTYAVQAVPQGAQATKDTKCGTLTVNQVGAKGESGTAANATECW